MQLNKKLAELRENPRTYHLTVRARLTLTYAGLLLIAGAIMLAIIYVFIGLVPTYEFGTATSLSEPAELYSTRGYELTAPDYGAVFPDGTTAIAQTVVVSTRDDILRLLLIISIATLIILGVGGAIVGWIMAGRMLKPLQYVNAAASRAAKGELQHRIELDGPRDEITDLAATFDEMLGSLERSFGTYRRFAANASHELRTPLATSRAMIDVALLESGESEKAMLLRLRETNERSINTVEALLDLAEIESAEPSHSPVNLHHLAQEVIDESTADAVESCITLESNLTTAVASGDQVLARQLIRNLVENGLRHNVDGGFVRVSTSRAPRWVSITVSNSGPAVAPESVEYLADPFYRDGGRTNTTGQPNRGLGLSIVSAIVDRHGGTLTITPRAGGGLNVTAEFPAFEA
ncbi:sensor histidine kinase [Lysinibacter cavernae]|uniref:histidine kinase n=1 Tax=Lysinibacter cavernae TaxID=1640652 RepID=A0A7X5R1V6_9MICO|nr:HAMP domain-containing sensor histidine kinase [Lysinibacter cavernae]NIH54165.1 two-component system sensor histidine kinase VanS [Lysinibacter cavernae]